MNIREIQAVNVQRSNAWHHGDFRNWSGLEWAGAMCGEAGEAANVAKKLRRFELALQGNQYSDNPVTTLERETLTLKLANECADTFLYLVLLAARYDIDLQSAIVHRFNEKSKEMGFPERLYDGNANWLKQSNPRRCVLCGSEEHWTYEHQIPPLKSTTNDATGHDGV